MLVSAISSRPFLSRQMTLAKKMSRNFCLVKTKNRNNNTNKKGLFPARKKTKAEESPATGPEAAEQGGLHLTMEALGNNAKKIKTKWGTLCKINKKILYNDPSVM